MKKAFIITLLFLLVLSCKPTKLTSIYSESDQEILIASVKKNKIIFKTDTTQLKNIISESLLNQQNGKNVFEKISIKSKLTMGDTIKTFYYLQLDRFSKKMKTVRYLKYNKKNKNLYLTQQDPEKMVFTSCYDSLNTGSCIPNFVINKGRSFWMYGFNQNTCMPGEGVKVFKSVIIN